MNNIITNPATKEVEDLDSYEKGLLFEDYIVTLFNKRKFQLLEWRGDKKASNGVLPLSSSKPDLEFAFLRKRNFRFAIECKWRSRFYNGGIYWADNYKINNYKDFQYQNNVTVFVAIGIGGHPSNPRQLFITPLDHICMFTEVYESHLMPYKRNFEHGIDDTEQLKLF